MNAITRKLLLNLFGRPRGVLGRVGGVIMARTNREFAVWVGGLLEVRPDDKVLELGFGPGMGIEFLARATLAGYVAGVDPSKEMVTQATARNADAIAKGRVDLRLGSAGALPFEADTFNEAMAINSLQVWPDAMAGLREVRRVLRPGGRLALGFTRYSGQPRAGLSDIIAAAGFSYLRRIECKQDFCELAAKP